MVPSLEDVMPLQSLPVEVIEVTSVQLAPESMEVQMFPELPAYSNAASLVPSLEDVMSVHHFVLPTEVQVPPESVEVQMFPP